MGAIAGVLLLLLGAGTCAAAFGLLQGKPWAWWLAVVLFTMDGAGDVLTVIATGDWWRLASGALISCVFLYILTRNCVRHYFKMNSRCPSCSF
jgi:hypothetical protein